MNNSQLSALASVDDICAGFKRGFQEIGIAAKQYAERRKTIPETKEEMIERGYDGSFLDKVESLANGKLDQRLLLPAGLQYKLLAKLNLPDQKKALDSGVEVLEFNGDTRIIPVPDLTPDQARQAIGKSLSQQKTWLNQHQQPAPKRGEEDVRITKEAVVFHGHKISKRTLLLWLQEMS